MDGFLVHNKCFVGRTLINMADGTQKTIDKIVVGDMVDTISGSQEVTRVESPTHNNLVEYFTGLVQYVQMIFGLMINKVGFLISNLIIWNFL